MLKSIPSRSVPASQSTEKHEPIIEQPAGDPRSDAGRLIYILAASHSGSTLLAMLLGSHADVCTPGELKANTMGNGAEYVCSCGVVIGECPFWRRVSEHLNRRGIDFEITRAGTDLGSGISGYVSRLLRPLHRGPVMERMRDLALAVSPAWRIRYPAVQRINTELVRSVRAVSGKRWVVDSSKIAIRLKYLLRNPGLDVKIVRMIRDGRGVALTYMEERGVGMAEAAEEWVRSNQEAEQLLVTIDRDRWIELRYEDLCLKTEETLRRVFEFVGVDPARSTRDFRSVEHHVIGNSMRLESTREIRHDVKWKSVLTPQHLEQFERVAGPLSRRYGYS